MIFGARIAVIAAEGDTLRLAVLESGGGTPVALEAHETRLPQGLPGERRQRLVTAFAELKARMKSKPSLVVLCASNQYAVGRQLTIPFKGRGKVAAAVPFELEPFLAFPIDEVVIDFNVVREIEGQTEVLVVGMRLAPLAETISAMEEAGFTVDGAAVDLSGLMALWSLGHKQTPGLFATLHIGDHESIIAIVRDKRLAFFRRIPIGADRIENDPGALAREVQNSLRAFLAHGGAQAEETFQSLTVTGLNEDDPLLTELREWLDIPIESMDLLAKIKGTAAALGKIEGDEPPSLRAWTALMGTAYSAASGKFAYDFRKGPLAAGAPIRGAASRLAFSGALALIALLGYTVYAYIDYSRIRNELDAISREMWAAYLETYPNSEAAAAATPEQYRPWQETYALFQAEFAKPVGSGAENVVTLFSRPTFLDILQELGPIFGSKMTITNLDMRWRDSDQIITIQGLCSDDEAYSAASQLLAAAKTFTIDQGLTRPEIGKFSVSLRVGPSRPLEGEATSG